MTGKGSLDHCINDRYTNNRYSNVLKLSVSEIVYPTSFTTSKQHANSKIHYVIDYDDPNLSYDSKNNVRNLRLTVAYDGTDYVGWQVQPGRPTVQGTLASAIGRLSGENVLPQGSGRTDAGVHALAQEVSFATASPIPVENWMCALNDILPMSIRVLKVVDVEPDFHARKTARAKTYRYRILRSANCPPFVARYVWHYPYPLDEAAMVEATAVVEGEHDFTSFAAVDPERVERMSLEANLSDHPTTNVRTIYSSVWTRDGEELIYTVRGSGFLHHMVRNLVGTFVLVGKRTKTKEDLHQILNAKERSAAGPTAPACGLYLVGVEY
jgi:tRNA pseudouridine38-40 synthase